MDNGERAVQIYHEAEHEVIDSLKHAIVSIAEDFLIGCAISITIMSAIVYCWLVLNWYFGGMVAHY